MINLFCLFLFFGIIVFSAVLCFRLYSKQTYRPDAPYLRYWSFSSIAAVILAIVGVIFVDPEKWEPLVPPVVGVIHHILFGGAVLGVLYGGVGFSVVLTGEDLRQIRYAGWIFGVALLLKGVSEALHQIGGIEIFKWRNIFLIPPIVGYALTVIYWYHRNAKHATPITKWRMHFAKVGSILCLISPIDWLLPFERDFWVVRPSILLGITAWTIFTIIGTNPEWFQELAVLFELRKRILRQNTFLLNVVADSLHANAQHIEPSLRRFAAALHFSEIRTSILVRAAYLKAIISERDQISPNLAVEVLEGEDVEPIIRYSTERWDGSGGPLGLSRERIPLESRILALIEAYTAELALNENPQAAIAQVKEKAGTWFDPQLVRTLEQVVGETESD